MNVELDAYRNRGFCDCDITFPLSYSWHFGDRQEGESLDEEDDLPIGASGDGKVIWTYSGRNKISEININTGEVLRTLKLSIKCESQAVYDGERIYCGKNIYDLETEKFLPFNDSIRLPIVRCGNKVYGNFREYIDLETGEYEWPPFFGMASKDMSFVGSPIKDKSRVVKASLNDFDELWNVPTTSSDEHVLTIGDTVVVLFEFKEESPTFRILSLATGEELWRLEMPYEKDCFINIPDRPKMAGDKIFFQFCYNEDPKVAQSFNAHYDSDTKMVFRAYDINDGSLIWQKDILPDRSCTLFVTRNCIIYDEQCKRIVALSNETGDELWASENHSEILLDNVIDGKVFVHANTCMECYS